jgi:hypothetical protein
MHFNIDQLALGGRGAKTGTEERQLKRKIGIYVVQDVESGSRVCRSRRRTDRLGQMIYRYRIGLVIALGTFDELTKLPGLFP